MVQKSHEGHAFPSFLEPVIQTMVFIAQNDCIELKNNKTKKKFDSDHFRKKFISKTFEIIISQKISF